MGLNKYYVLHIEIIQDANWEDLSQHDRKDDTLRTGVEYWREIDIGGRVFDLMRLLYETGCGVV